MPRTFCPLYVGAGRIFCPAQDSGAEGILSLHVGSASDDSAGPLGMAGSLEEEGVREEQS